MALASDVLNRVRDTLLDPNTGAGYRWPDAELLRWLSDGQNTVCGIAPEAHTLTAAITPDVADVRIDIRVRLPTPVPVTILRFTAQHDAKNNIEGAALPVIEKHVLDALDPAWLSYRPATPAAVTAGAFTVGAQYVIATVGSTDFTLIGAGANTAGLAFVATGAGTGTGTATPANYNTPATAPAAYYKAVVTDPKDPFSFWLYPRAHPSFKVYVTYAAVPVALTAVGDTLALPDQFVPILHDYVCYRTMTKDTIYTGAPAKAEEFKQSFLQALSALTGRRVDLSPTKARAPGEH